MPGKLDFNVGDVQAVYDGPVGLLWELLMGEQIHVGGVEESGILADKAGVTKTSHVLDVCSALGGPARYLAENFGCRVTGLDITGTMLEKAETRTRQAGLENRVGFRRGNALDMPFKVGSFDIVWGQDAWCYVTDKGRLISECRRVLKSGGTLAFSDWLITDKAEPDDLIALNTFMVFPYMETLDGYTRLLKENGFILKECEDLQTQFAHFMHVYHEKYHRELKDSILQNFGQQLFDAGAGGLDLWMKAADAGKVTRGRFIAVAG